MRQQDDVTMLDLHRELCAAVRNADQAFSRLYVAAPDSEAALQGETRYLLALAQAKAALRALETAYGDALDAEDPGYQLVAESARRVC